MQAISEGGHDGGVVRRGQRYVASIHAMQDGGGVRVMRTTATWWRYGGTVECKKGVVMLPLAKSGREVGCKRGDGVRIMRTTATRWRYGGTVECKKGVVMRPLPMSGREVTNLPLLRFVCVCVHVCWVRDSLDVRVFTTCNRNGCTSHAARTPNKTYRKRVYRPSFSNMFGGSSSARSNSPVMFAGHRPSQFSAFHPVPRQASGGSRSNAPSQVRPCEQYNASPNGALL